MVSVDIAMATYNGEKYIVEQINSIINQTVENWTLYISDDDSLDNTVALIKEFALVDDRIILINEERQGGVLGNFNKVLEATKADYVFLADQDDVWPRNRVELLLGEIQKKDKNTEGPMMIYSDLELVDENLNTIAESFYNSCKIKPLENIDPINLLWKCSVYGCTTVFNRALLKKCLPIPNGITMHDNWLALNAATENGLFYFDQTTIKYRQHDNNVVGGGRSFFKKIRYSLVSFRKILANREKINNMLISSKKIHNNDVLNNLNLDDHRSMMFSFNHILPHVLCGSRRVFSFFNFIGFLIRK
ncbi:glycosyltransferase family 2 protein [Pectobacterium punjabense]|uniref:glycosyltransferase family 2 protein n=1 Tax=Pectobacterium punjabense TaxID=2108399 RepID=UPI001BFFA476|nr:glycosyltransferase family 2 protein [Pectobacterium punjabense]MBT9184864.1 glycosyltransferase family 2 protein [Pectobacterium punjabense]